MPNLTTVPLSRGNLVIRVSAFCICCLLMEFTLVLIKSMRICIHILNVGIVLRARKRSNIENVKLSFILLGMLPRYGSRGHHTNAPVSHHGRGTKSSDDLQTNKQVNQTNSQQNNQATPKNEPTNQLTNHRTNQQTTEATNYPHNQPANNTTNKPINERINQPNN